MIKLTKTLNGAPERKCSCYLTEYKYCDFTETIVGVDKRHGRFAEITLLTCTFCGTKWVHYHAEFESFSRSGRWYRGIIHELKLKKLTPENAVEYLESLDWYIFGGSYFSSTGMYGKGKVQADL